MKLKKQASGISMVKVSQLEWYAIGKTAGWTTISMDESFAKLLQDLYKNSDSEGLKELIVTLQRDRRDLMGQVRSIDEKIRTIENSIRPPDFSRLRQGFPPS